MKDTILEDGVRVTKFEKGDTCPFCSGKGVVYIMNEVDNSVRGEMPCGACLGTGVCQGKNTNGDKVRHMTDRELAEFFICHILYEDDYKDSKEVSLSVGLNQEVEWWENWLGEEVESIV